MDRNPDSPWNPAEPTTISPEEFEVLVAGWLQQWASQNNHSMRIQHHGRVQGGGGEYDIDVLISLTLFHGAVVTILAECKHKSRPIDRDTLLTLGAKVRDAKAHKGMLFSTSGFQRGAIEYAKSQGIATITVVPGNWIYETKSTGGESRMPSWVPRERYIGLLLAPVESGITSSTIEIERLDAIDEWINQVTADAVCSVTAPKQ